MKAEPESTASAVKKEPVEKQVSQNGKAKAAQVKPAEKPSQKAKQTDKQKPTKASDKFQQDSNGAETTAAAGGGVSSSSSKMLVPASGPDQPAASGSADAPAPDLHDVTDGFGPQGRPETSTGKPASTVSAREQFRDSDLVVPGIAVKKMKLAMDQSKQDRENYIAVLGGDTVKAYRNEKPGVNKMILGDVLKYNHSFWAKVAKHLHGMKAVLLMVATEAEELFVSTAPGQIHANPYRFQVSD